jgi:hypothetical protein
MATPVKPLRYTTENREIAYETARMGLREKFVSKEEYYREIRRLNTEENKYRRRIGARNFNEVRAYQQDIIAEENRRRAERVAEQARREERRNIEAIRRTRLTNTTTQMGITRNTYDIPGRVAINTPETERVLANTIVNQVKKFKKGKPQQRRYVIRIKTNDGVKTLGEARELLGTQAQNERAIARDIFEWRKKLLEEYEAELDIDEFEIVELLSKAEVEAKRKQRQQEYFKQQKQLERYAFIDDDEKPKRKQLATKASKKVPIRGGCDSNTHHKKVGDLKVMSPKSRNNNCLLACIHHFLDIKTDNKFIYEHKRKELGLPDGLISIDKLTDVARHYKITINLFNIGAELVNTYNAGCDKVCNMMLFIQENGLGHYVLIEGEVKLCDKCGKNWIKKHKCNLRRQMWINRMSGKRNVIPANVNRDTKHDDSQMFYFDLETFKDEGTDAITPYAVGWFCNEEYQQRYGKDAWDEFYRYTMQQRNKILCAYNGSSFDFHFLLNHLLMEGEQIKDMILSNGRIMSFTFGDNIRCWDLCLFTLSPLKDACKDFKVSDDNAKTEFDHFKMTSWEKVEQYRHEVEPYLKRDVLGMKEVYEKFSDMIYDIFKVHMVEFITLSSMSYAIWTSTLNDKADFLEIPGTEKYEFIRLSLFGGRTYPMRREFTSKHYYDIVENSDNPEKLKETYKTMDDWIFNADATSLYPTAMVDFKYPMGEGKWVENPADISKIGFYDVEVECNQNLIVPVLPEKKPDGGITWNLKPKRGVYTSVDLENALQNGYTITKIHRGLVYDGSDDIFTKYIMKCYKIKEENEDNPVKRQVGKILMNALYGKMLEKARFEESKLCNNIDDVYEFLNDFEVSDVQFIRDKVILIGVPATIDIKDLRVKKPSQIGSFILAYSRRHMLNAMTAICPKLDEHFFTYTDTDSLHIHASTLPGLKEKGWLEKGLGKLSDDAKGGKIFREINLAPKLYMYLCLMPDGKIKNVMKSKGIPKQYLSPHLFENADDLDDNERVVIMKNRLKRVGLGRNINIAWRKYDAFSILSVDMERTFYKNMWEGMDYENGYWFPKK